jgi:uncharacterized protein (TIGR03435 family)
MLRLPRAVRVVGMASVGGTLCVIVAAAVVLCLPRSRSPHWATFTIGPASSSSSSVQADGIRAEGLSLKSAIALAYDFPAVRVIAPAWMSERRYSLSAIVPREAVNDAATSWRPLLQQELVSRLRLQTHIEHRPFDVLVLTTGGTPRLTPSAGGGLSVWVSEHRVRFHNATTGDLASVLHGILGVPVVDETNVRGAYDLEFGWRDDRLPSVTTALEEQYGLRLSAGRRELEALIVDDARRDASLVLLAQIERATRAAPESVRRRIANLLSVR